MDDKWEVENESGLLELLETSDGNPILIIHNGKTLGTLLPAPKRDILKARAAADRLRQMSKSATLGSEITISQLIEEGRKY